MAIRPTWGGILKKISHDLGEITRGFRIDVEYAASHRWYKKAKPVFDEKTGALMPWEPKSEDV